MSRRLTGAHRSPRLCGLLALVAMVTVAGCGGSVPVSDTGASAVLMVGTAKRDITPATPVYLGGYGFGPERRSTGVLAPIYVRAMVISDGTRTLAFAENETQGAFAEYKRGPFGLTDVAAAVEAATGGQIPREHVIVGSDHTHSGPDTTGIWGGVSPAYSTFLRDQMVGAIVDAFTARAPARLLTGTADATALLHSQFDAPPNDKVAGELRVLVAVDPNESSRHTGVLINFAAHGTVMGAANTLLSADWPGVVATQVEQALQVDTAVVMVADVGRTQPNRADQPDETDPEKLDAYASAVTAHVLAAVGTSTPAHGTQIDAAQFFLREPYANSFFDAALLSGLIARLNQPPWLAATDDGTDIGTLVSAVRVGDLFFAAVPGEAYPAIQFALQERVPAARHFIFGLANDQLGYLIAPAEGYPQIAAAAPDNDNALFNVSPTIGDHVMCTLFKAARRIGFELPDDPARCAPYAAEDNQLPF